MPAITDRSDIQQFLGDPTTDVSGYRVVAIDDVAGALADKQDQVDHDHLVVHVGPPILGNDVVIETEVIIDIDTAEREIRVDRIADWVKSSPKLKQFQQSH